MPQRLAAFAHSHTRHTERTSADLHDPQRPFFFSIFPQFSFKQLCFLPALPPYCAKTAALLRGICRLFDHICRQRVIPDADFNGIALADPVLQNQLRRHRLNILLNVSL